MDVKAGVSVGRRGGVKSGHVFKSMPGGQRELGFVFYLALLGLPALSEPVTLPIHLQDMNVGSKAIQ